MPTNPGPCAIVQGFITVFGKRRHLLTKLDFVKMLAYLLLMRDIYSKEATEEGR